MKGCVKVKKLKKIMILLVIFSFIANIVPVNAATPDIEPPVLKKFNINNKMESYNLGDRVYFDLDAADDISKLESVGIGICLYNKDGDFPCMGNTSSSRIGLEVYDFSTNPYIVLPNILVKGEYVVESVSLCDSRFNCISYDLYDYMDESMSKLLGKTITFDINSDKEFLGDYNLDDSALKSFELDKTSIKPGEKIKVTGVVTDENVDYLHFYLRNEEETVWMDFNMKLESSSNGEYVFVGYIDCPYRNGNYKIDSVSLMMYDENYSNTARGISVDDEKFMKTIKVVGNKTKTPNFKFKRVIYDEMTLIAPSTYKLSLEVEDKNHLVNEALVTIANSQNEYLTFSETLKLDDNGNLTGYFNIDQFTSPGEYYIKNVEFGMNTSKGGWIFSDFYELLNDNVEVPEVTLFEVIDSDFYDVITSTVDKNILDKIKKADNGAKIGISAVDDSVIKKEVFEVIQNTNKTIYIESNGIKWIFNGKNIKNPKDIDTEITLNKLEDDFLNEKIGKYFNKGIVVNFKDNGELPGVALVKIKTDYVFRNYLGSDNLQVYHYNKNNNAMFDEVANNISITKDYDLQFYISHNSSFVISSDKVDDKYISDNVEDLSFNDKTVSVNDNDKVNEKENNNILLYSLIGLGVLVVAIIVVVVIQKKRKTKGKENKNIDLAKEKKSVQKKK